MTSVPPSSPTSSAGSSPFGPAATPVVTASPSNLDPTVGDMAAFRLSERGQRLQGWVRRSYTAAKDARRPKEIQWYTNLSMALGSQWIRKSSGNAPGDQKDKLIHTKAPYYKNRRTVNRIRRFARWELSKLTSQTPAIISVPGTSTDEDLRASDAAEQVWESQAAAGKLRKVWTISAWWMVHTGNGFLKCEWDPSIPYDEVELGDIRYSNLTPFNVFVPDLTEPEIEDQPFVMLAYTKPLQWANTFFKDALGGIVLEGKVAGSNDLLDAAYLSSTKQQDRVKDAVIVYEVWVKPGACDELPNGGLVIMVDDYIVNVVDTGLPYKHGMYPITHFGHLYTGGFYRDSPIVDLVQLQKEYNLVRSDIGEAARRTARPQYAVQKGSMVVSRWTNEHGAVVEYNPGTPAPSLVPMPEMPSYALQQLDRIMNDWDELSGESDASTGQAPQGVSAGTAINYLQEASNRYLSPQFDVIEQGWEKLANQTVGLFVQYVDLPRKVKVAGADHSFDLEQLSGSDIKNGTDLRVEANSATPVSKAAVEAKVMDMFSIGLIDQPMAFKMLEVNGFQKMQDIIKVAERKAQRENIKMKQLTLQSIQQAKEMQLPELITQVEGQQPGASTDPNVMQQIEQWMPCVIEPADFDVHQTHIAVHNQFRMGQEFEALPAEIQNQFKLHVEAHQAMLQQAQLQQFLQQVPDDGSGGGAPTADMPPGAAATQAIDQGQDPGAGDPSQGMVQPAQGAVPAGPGEG